ncbi:MAG: hypothetical protein ACREO0_15080 [Pseudoxanthomonas sp.]
MSYTQFPVPKYATEAELCADFAQVMGQDGWLVYPETAGFDLVLVREDTGFQLGVEAKLALNAKVCEQILPSIQSAKYDITGPDWRAVLVPTIGGNAGIAEMLGILGVMTFTPTVDYQHRDGRGYGYQLAFKYQHQHSWLRMEWHDWNPEKRLELPAFARSDMARMAAGTPAPIQLTPWKLGTIKLLAILQVHGHVTRKDCAECRVDARRFCASDGLLSQLGDGKWGRGPRTPRFDQQHPATFADFVAKELAKLEVAKG